MFGRGGITRHALDLGDWLEKNGHQVRYAGTPGPWLDDKGARTFYDIGLRRLSEDGGSLVNRLLGVLPAVFKLRRALKQDQINIIHTHETAPAIVARLAALGMNIPILMTYHGSLPERIGNVGKVAKWTTNKLISLSNITRDRLVEIGGLPPERIKVTGLGVKELPAADEGQAAALRKEILPGTANLLVVVVARLVPQKGLDLFSDVVARVVAERKDIHFALVGDGPLEDEVEEWARERGVHQHIHFAGFTEDVPIYLKASDVFLLTSIWEERPISIVEAFRSGLPVVATDTGGVRELVVSSVGRVAKVGDVPALADYILEICGDTDLRDAMSTAAFERGQLDQFSIPKIHALVEKTYYETLEAARN